MNNLLKTIKNDFNLKKQAEDLGVRVWQTPSFMFILLGALVIIVMSVVYYSVQYYDSPELLVASEAGIVILILTAGSYVIRDVETMARMGKMRTDFISIASHQLKTPLSQVNWETELLLTRHAQELMPKQKEIIMAISQANANMTRLVNDLLDVVRIDQGELFLTRETCDVYGLIQEVVNNNNGLAKKNNVEVKILKMADLPSLSLDKRRILVVLDNLISNAIKYVEKQGLVEIRIEKKRNFAIISVKDNGVGIPEEQQYRVFEKFFRSDNAVRYRTDGTGLGLYITKNIIEQSGGTIWFKSIEEIGSIFSFSLPLSDEKETKSIEA